MLVFFAVGWFGTDWYLARRTVSYNSRISGLTFKYPAGRKKLDANGMSTMGGISGIENYNETLLADSTSNNMKYLMGSGSVQVSPEQWETHKDQLRRVFSGTGSDLTAGTALSMSDGTVTDTTVGKANALDMKFRMTSQGYTFDCRAEVVHNATTMYFLLFMTRGEPAKSSEQVQKVIDSVEFAK